MLLGIGRRTAPKMPIVVAVSGERAPGEGPDGPIDDLRQASRVLQHAATRARGARDQPHCRGKLTWRMPLT